MKINVQLVKPITFDEVTKKVIKYFTTHNIPFNPDSLNILDPNGEDEIEQARRLVG